MFKVGSLGLERFEEIFQHAQVGLHLIFLEPPLHQAGLLVQCGVDQVGDVAQLSGDRGALLPVGEIDREQRRPRDRPGDAAGQAHDLPVPKLGEVPHRGQSDQPRCARHHNLFPRQRHGHGRHRRPVSD
jgi:hypothetical protein